MVAWTFFVFVTVVEAWRFGSKYWDLFIRNDPFQDRIELLTACYTKQNVDCEKLMLHHLTGLTQQEVKVQYLSFKYLRNMHNMILRAQTKWIVGKCSQFEVPPVRDALDMATRQAILLQKCDMCMKQVQLLRDCFPYGSDTSSDEGIELGTNLPIDEEKDSSENHSDGKSLSGHSSEELYRDYDEFLEAVFIILRNSLTERSALQSLYRPHNHSQ